MDFNVDEKDLYDGIVLLNTIGNMLIEFYSVINSIDISDVELKTSYLLENDKKNVFTITNIEFKELYNKIINIKNLLCQSNVELGMLFSDLDDDILHFDEFIENSNNVTLGMLYDQSNYKNIKYCSGTLASHGGGFFSILSVITAKTGHVFNDNEISELATLVNEPIGLSITQRMELLADTLSEKYGFTWKKGAVSDVNVSLEEGKAIVAYTKDSNGSNSHLVPITGKLDNGNLVVNDSNGWTYRSSLTRRKRIDELGFNMENGEFAIASRGSDQNGDGIDDDVWYFDFGDVKNTVFNYTEGKEPFVISDSVDVINENENLINISNEYLHNKWSGVRLTARMGYNENGPSGYETWYDLGMSRVVENMEKLYGYTDLKYDIRDDGVKLLSGKTPDGEVFKNLVMVAADVRHEDANPEGTFERGQIVETSLGTGIVVDYCGEAVRKRKNGEEVHFDIATAWHTGKYMAIAYGDDNNNVSVEYPEQIVPGQATTLEFDLGNVDKTTVNLSTNEFDLFSEFEENLDNQSENELSNEFNETLNNQSENNNVDFDASVSNIKPKNNSDISHRGYTPGNIYDNSAEGFILAGENGFWGCEADVRFDLDGNLVCSHNTVVKGQNPTSFEEYLDICKEYGMTAIIDLKYEKGVGPADPNLSPMILKTIQDKGMMDSCILQTNNYTDIPYIRENSEDARIWYLTDVISDKNLKLIEENGVECVNILSSENNAYRINKLNEKGIDVCVWNVQTESLKDSLLNVGAKYVMSDNVLGITPYQEGEVDFNEIEN